MKKYRFNFLILSIILGISIASCKKEDESEDTNTPSEIELQPNVKLIDTTITQLVSDSIQLSQGIYTFTFTGTAPVLAVGDVIVGETGEGYLRKVTSVTTQDGNIICQTEQADLGDLFNTAEFSFETGISPGKSSVSQSNVTYHDLQVEYLAPGVTLSPDGLTYDFSNTTIYQNNNITFKITDGSVNFEPNFIANIEYEYGLPTKISILTDNASLSMICKVNLNASGSEILSDHKIILANIYRPITVMVGPVPVVVVVHTQLTAKLNTTVNAALNINAGVTKNYNLTLGAVYENNQWTGIYNLTDNEAFLPVNWEGGASLTHKLTITPEVDFKLYGIVGPYFRPDAWETLNMKMAIPSLNWNAALNAGIDANLGVDLTIFKKTFASYNYSPEGTIYELWKAPNEIVIESGNEQSGPEGQDLLNPLKVSVKDNAGNLIAAVPVEFQVTQGGGSVSDVKVTTDSDGYAETNWTLGTETEVQNVTATIKDGNNTIIQSVSFTATTDAVDTLQLLTNGNSKTWREQVLFQEYCDTVLYDVQEYVIFNQSGSVVIHWDFLNTSCSVSDDSYNWNLQNNIIYLNDDGDIIEALIIEISQDYLKLYFTEGDYYLTFDTNN
jgi:hypothetical protein